MIKWFKRLLGIEKLQLENEELKKKLEERQLAINKTNAYWKGVVRDLKKKKV
jgi:hypothetical protein